MMKKLLTSALCAASVGLFAQADFEIELISPAASATIDAGVQFTFEVEITNTGTVDVTANDTVRYLPTFDGSPLTIQGGGTLVYGFTGTAIAANGSVTRSHTLSISGGNSGPTQLCAELIVSGPSFSTAAQANDCHSVNYNAGSVSVDELRLNELEDNSFYSNGTYNVRVENAFDHNNVSYSLVNIAGQKVSGGNLEINRGAINQEVAVGNLPSGIYIFTMTSDSGVISSRKVMIQ